MGKFVFIPLLDFSSSSSSSSISVDRSCQWLDWRDMVMVKWLDGVLFNLCSTQNDVTMGLSLCKLRAVSQFCDVILFLNVPLSVCAGDVYQLECVLTECYHQHHRSITRDGTRDERRHSKQIKSWSKIRFLVSILKKKNPWHSGQTNKFKSKEVDGGN